MGSFWQIAPRFDCLLGTGSLHGPAKLQNEANVAGEVADPHPSSPRATQTGTCPTGEPCRFVHPTPSISRTSLRESLITAAKRRRSSMASCVYMPCLSAFLLPRGAPDPGAPPCIRQRLLPLTAAERLRNLR